MQGNEGIGIQMESLPENFIEQMRQVEEPSPQDEVEEA